MLYRDDEEQKNRYYQSNKPIYFVRLLQSSTVSDAIEPFHINISQSALDD